MRPVSPDEEGADNVSELLYDLNPWTQYAVYVQAYTIASSDRGAMSPIVYFRTKPDGLYNYRPQGKVMFSEASVSHSVHSMHHRSHDQHPGRFVSEHASQIT